jgi:hypothetical protein
MPARSYQQFVGLGDQRAGHSPRPRVTRWAVKVGGSGSRKRGDAVAEVVATQWDKARRYMRRVLRSCRDPVRGPEPAVMRCSFEVERRVPDVRVVANGRRTPGHGQENSTSARSTVAADGA